MRTALALIAASRRFRLAGAPPADPPVATTITITGGTTVVEGSTIALAATVNDQYGTAMTGQVVTWTSDSAHATVGSSSGIVSGATAGTAGITAHVGALSSAPYTVTVTAAAPAALAAGTTTVAPGDGQVVVSWTPATGGTAPYTYQLHRSTDGSLGTQIVGATSPYTDSGLTNGVDEYYTVVATDSAGASVTYGQRVATPSTPVEGAPATPTGLHTTSVTDTSLAFAWDANPDRTTGISWRLYYSKTSPINYDTAPYREILNGYSTASTITNLDGGRTYYCDLEARWSTGEGAVSRFGETAFTTNPSPPQPIWEWQTTYASGASSLAITDRSRAGSGTIASYLWELRDTGNVLVASSTTASPTFSGLADGSYTLTATVSNTGGIETSVVAPLVIAATVQPFAADDFASGDRSHTTPYGFYWGSVASGQMSVASDIAHSGTYSLKFHFNAKLYDGTQTNSNQVSADAEQRFDLGREFVRLWQERWIYFPDGTEVPSVGPKYVHRDLSGLPENNKFMFLSDDPKWESSDYHVKTVIEHDRSTLTSGDSRLLCKMGTNAARGGRVSAEWGNPRLDPLVGGPIPRGQWVQLREEWWIAESGVSNGGYRMWANGVKIYEVTNVSNRAVDGAWHGYRYGYFFGYANTGFDEDTYVYIDDVKWYDQNPGWGS